MEKKKRASDLRSVRRSVRSALEACGQVCEAFQKKSWPNSAELGAQKCAEPLAKNNRGRKPTLIDIVKLQVLRYIRQIRTNFQLNWVDSTVFGKIDLNWVPIGEMQWNSAEIDWIGLNSAELGTFGRIR